MRENFSLDDLKKTWMASDKYSKTIFFSAKTRENLDEFRRIIYEEVRKIHITRYPYNDFLYEADPQSL